MTPEPRVTLSWTALIAGVAVLLAVGAGATYLAVRPPTAVSLVSAAIPPVAPSGASEPNTPTTPVSPSDVVVPLTKEAATRAGITLTAVKTGPASEGLRVPGVVEPNAYKVVAVTPLAAGRIASVSVELGQHVEPGQTMAQVFSPELADLQTRYIGARAELGAHERELARTEKLVQVGSASRQELERLHAEHTAQLAAVQSAASRLRLLGFSDAGIEQLDAGKPLDTAVKVPAPIAGVVTERLANVGLNVDPATKLFSVVDLSTVWVVANVFEKDLARVRVGASARVTTPAYPDRAVDGRISYVDPQLNAETRTVKIRIEVPNARGEWRIGMLAEVLLAGEKTASLVIPRSAVQNVGELSVVYLVNPEHEGQFIERPVRLGTQSGDHVVVVSGVQVGDTVVAEGSFFLRAERERLGLRPASTAPTAGRSQPPTADSVQTARITVGEKGFEPARVTLRAGVPARLTFVRTTDKTCATEVVFPTLSMKRALPLNEPVVIEFTPAKAGEVGFACGMNMVKGTVVVR